MSTSTAPVKSRVALRQERNREALVAAGYRVISEKGIDAATMQEIAQLADVGAGTVYSYFKSKDDLAVSVMERVMHNLALRIEEVTNTFSDPAQVYAFGVRTVIEQTTSDIRWKQLLNRPEVIAEAMFRCMGPFATRDLENATKAGRFKVPDAQLTWKMASYAIVGVGVAVNNDLLPPSILDETVIRLLCMTGIGEAEAIDLAGRPRPALPPEKSGI
ncbi:TetR/AcrR family transcriptional regulator [Rhizobium leguminosarum]|uniref:TetR/AcrR family transcriptional regulator n=1 Tax=Rhizobium leguminosarum TaxID=384 RepID=UPI0003F802C1|nr:TetR/AcrR family transcriptional regulator [Rhizobium leguminosarum]UIJ83196.1 TetR/AcrR family transcriptional regulator [Rhizobium leguminosarum]